MVLNARSNLPSVCWISSHSMLKETNKQTTVFIDLLACLRYMHAQSALFKKDKVGTEPQCLS